MKSWTYHTGQSHYRDWSTKVFSVRCLEVNTFNYVFHLKGVSFGGSRNPMRPQCTGVKEKIIWLVWLWNPKPSSEQSTGKMTATTMRYSRCWCLLENGAPQTPINTQIHPRISFDPSLWKPQGGQRKQSSIFNCKPQLKITHLTAWQLFRKRLLNTSAKSEQKQPPKHDNLFFISFCLMKHFVVVLVECAGVP